jgi:formiminotetrahydrofolate cyclodeaminase
VEIADKPAPLPADVAAGLSMRLDALEAVQGDERSAAPGGGWTVALVSSAAVALLLLAAGWVWRKFKERKNP